MFTGIIRELGKVAEVKKTRQTTLMLSLPKNFKPALGDSIACNGVCLTVSKIDKNIMSLNVMDETFKKTNMDRLKAGDSINLEPASRVGDKLDGHIVQGHVDGIGQVKNIVRKSNGRHITIEFPGQFKNLIVEKGSVSADGISLTVFDVSKNQFLVSLVEFTLKNTTAGSWRVGQSVNLEFDILGKYVAKILNK